MSHRVFDEKPIKIIYEDQKIIVITKAPGVGSQPDKTGHPAVSLLLKRSLYVVHRLDRPVGGVMVYAKDPKTAADLNAQIQKGAFRKLYWAVVCGKAAPEASFTDYLIKNQRLNFSKVVQKNCPGSKESVLKYRLLAHIQEEQWFSLVEIELLTGRHHQIRVQMAYRQLPIWGDFKYYPQMKQRDPEASLALWSKEIAFLYPGTHQPTVFSAEPDGELFKRLMEKMDLK